MKIQGFHVLDYIVFILVIIISSCIAMYQTLCKNANSTSQYLMGGRQLHLVPTAISLLISFISSVSILGNSAETYFYGVNYYGILLGYVFAAGLASMTFVPLLYPLKITSINEYIYLRFGSRPLVYLVAVLKVLSLLIVNAITLYGPALMMKSMIGVPVWISIMSLGLLSSIYTSLGGLKGVIWSDVFQTAVIVAGLLAIVILGTIEVGGVREVWHIYGEHQRLQIHWSLLDRSSLPAFSIGVALGYTCLLGASQLSVQRFCALPSLQAAKRSLWLTIPVSVTVQSLTCTAGVVVFAYFAKQECDPYKAGYINNKNQILPYFIRKVLNYPAVPGTFMACICCGSLSNLSSAYNSGAAMVWQDMIGRFFRKYSDRRKTLLTKLISFLLGVFSMLVGIIITYTPGTLVELTITFASLTMGPLMVVIVCGAISARINYKSALLGAVAALATASLLSFSQSQAHDFITPTVTSGCPLNTLLLHSSNSSVMETSTHNIMFDVNTTTDSFHANHSNDRPWYLRVPFPLFLSIGITSGVVTALVLSFLPGLKEAPGKVDESLLFTFLRSLPKNCCRNEEYKEEEQQETGQEESSKEAKGLEMALRSPLMDTAETT